MLFAGKTVEKGEFPSTVGWSETGSATMKTSVEVSRENRTRATI